MGREMVGVGNDGEMEKGAAEGRKGGGDGLRASGAGQDLGQAESAKCTFGKGPRQASPAMLAGAETSGLQHCPLTYTVASSRAWSWCPPPRGRRGPHTSSSQCCRGTGWARSIRAHHTREQTVPEAGGAGGPPPRGCVLVHAGIGFSPLLLERRAKGGSSAQVPISNSEPQELPVHY